MIPSWILRNVNPDPGKGAGAIAGVGTVGKESIGFSNRGTGVSTTPVGFPSKFIIFSHHLLPKNVILFYNLIVIFNIFIQFLQFFAHFQKLPIFRTYDN